MIAASTVLDGRGGILHDTRVVVEGEKIVGIDASATPITYDLAAGRSCPAGSTPTSTSGGILTRAGGR